MIIEKFSLEGKVAIVTGGGTGLGRAIALTLAEAGADIVLTARRIEPLEETASEVNKLGRRAFPVSMDFTVSSQVANMVGKTIKEFGRIDILVNNAGAAIQFMNLPVTEIKDDQWRQGIDIDLTGAFYCSRAVAKEMMKSGGGKIVNMSSMSAIVGLPASPIYGIAKAGVINMTRLFAVALAPYKILVNCIVAGPFGTRAVLGDDYQDKEAARKRGRYVPVGHLGYPEEMGPLALLLASSASDYITGQVFIIDGGTEAGRYAPVGFVMPERKIEELWYR